MLRDLRPVRANRPGGWFFAQRRNRRLGKSQLTRDPAATEPAPRRTLPRVLLCLGIAAGLCGVGLGGRALLVSSTRFAFTDIRTGALKHLDPDRLLAKSGLQLGRSLFALDLAAAQRRLAQEPWVQTVRVRRELPHTVAIDVVEREAKAAVVLGPIYLVDERGEPFKRARAEETAGVPIVTGLQRDRFLADPPRARATLRRAIELDRAWRAQGSRAPLGELHHDGGHDVAATFTGYFAHAGRPVGVRLGAPDASTADRLKRLDAVLAALDREGARASFIHLDQRTMLDRVAVRLADATDSSL